MSNNKKIILKRECFVPSGASYRTFFPWHNQNSCDCALFVVFECVCVLMRIPTV